MKQNPDSAGNDTEDERYQEHMLLNDMNAFQHLFRDIKKDSKHFKKLVKAVNNYLEKKKSLASGYDAKIMRAESLGEHEKYIAKLRSKKEKALAKLTKKDFKDIQELISRMRLSALTKKLEEIENRMGAEIQRIAQDESQEIKARHRMAAWFRKNAYNTRDKVAKMGYNTGQKLKGVFGNV